MDIYIYETGESGKLSLKGITDRIRSVSISRRFFSGDSFKAVFSGTERNRRLIAQGRIIEIPSVFSGCITGISLGRDKNGCGVITAEGSSFDGMLSRRVLAAGAVSDSFMTVLDKNAGEAAEEERRFPCTYFDKEADCDGMLEDGLYYQSLGEYIKTVGREKLFGVKSEIVHGEDNEAYIRIYGRYGADRSVLQNENRPVVLSDAYGSVTDTAYKHSEKGAVNGAFIYSEPQYDMKGDVNLAGWEKHFGSASGYGRCEKVYKIDPVVRYVATAYGEGYIWSPVLDKEKTEKRAEKFFLSRFTDFTDSFSAALRLGNAGKYSFEAGDVVTLYSAELGRTVHERVYEIEERYENGAHYAVVYIGSSRET